MITSVDGARQYLLGLLPPGATDFLYDDTASGDVYKLFDAFGQLVKTYGLDLLATLRRELIPSPSMTLKLLDWEKALGITSRLAAAFGTTAQRQSAVIAKLREFGAFCDPVMQSIFGPLLGYFDATPVKLMKCDREQLRLLHSYGLAVDVVVGPGATVVLDLFVHDGGRVARCGVQLDMNFSGISMDVQLTSPGGTSVTVPTVSETPMRFSSLAFVGKPCRGSWKLTLQNFTGAPITLYSAPWLFVEGIGQNLDTGGASAHWGVYADPAHLAENGNAADFNSVLRVIARAKHSHTYGSLVTSLTPTPDLVSATPDRCIPV